MVVTTMSTSPAASFHVVPPPPPRPRRWSEFVIALALALLLNLALILPFLLTNPAPNPAADPPAITVELVTEEEAPPPPAPEEAPAEEEKPLQPRTFTRSGGEAETVPGPDETDEAPPAEPEPEPQPVERKEETGRLDIPDWARTVERSYSAPAPSTTTSSASGGDAYLNKLKALITSKVDLNEITGLRGTADFMLLVHRSGVLLDAKMVRSSGNPRLDGAFIEAIRQSRQLLPFPTGYPADVVPLELTLTAAEPEN